ncbi:hypothetical protein DFH09DRAFT_1285623 [Mycena vulgaris]|nr:hypothetical protein DFH09DRAFT_1285623 [Mycena vulgaris]
MAEIDVLTNQTKHEGQLDGYIYANIHGDESAATPLSCRHPRTHGVQQERLFSQTCERVLGAGPIVHDSEANLTSGSLTGKNFSLQSTCQGSTMLGGNFQ